MSRSNFRRRQCLRQLATWQTLADQATGARQLRMAAVAVDLDDLELDAPLIDADLHAVQADAGATFDVGTSVQPPCSLRVVSFRFIAFQACVKS